MSKKPSGENGKKPQIQKARAYKQKSDKPAERHDRRVERDNLKYMNPSMTPLSYEFRDTVRTPRGAAREAARLYLQ